jgi:hypothetical protein
MASEKLNCRLDFADLTVGAFVDLTVGALVDLIVGALVDLTVGALVDLTVGAFVDLILGAFDDFEKILSSRFSTCKKSMLEFFVSVNPDVFILEMYLKVLYLHRNLQLCLAHQTVVGTVPSLRGQHQLQFHPSPLL